MVLKQDQERIKTLLKDTITLLCKNGLTFKNEFSLEALIGITLDKDEVVLVSINEIVQSEMAARDKVEEVELEASDGWDSAAEGPSPKARRHRKRRRSKTASYGSSESDVNDERNVSPPPEKKPIIKKEESSSNDDLVFVKQEIDGALDWSAAAEAIQEPSFPSFPVSTSAGLPSQENLDFLATTAGMEPLPAHTGDGLLRNNNNHHHRRTATVTTSSEHGLPDSQMGFQGPAGRPSVTTTTETPVAQDEPVEPLMLTSKASALNLTSSATSTVQNPATSAKSLPLIHPQLASLAHNLVVLGPALAHHPLALMSPPLGLPVPQNLSMVSPIAKALTGASISTSIPPIHVPRGVANLTVTSPSIRGPRLANDLPLTSPVGSLKSYVKGRRASVSSSTSSMDPPPASPLGKPKAQRVVRRNSLDVVVSKLNESQEQEIITFVNNMAQLGFKVTVKEVCSMAHEMIFPKRQYKKMDFANVKTFGADWWKEFLARHPEVEEKGGQVLPCAAPRSV